MNYLKHYQFLIERAKTREEPEFFEKHHITPRCLGGSDSSSNIVKLTPREHFIAHLLLWKIHPEHQGLSFAVVMMGKRNNRKYGFLKKVASEQNIAKTPEEKKKRSERMKGNSYGVGPNKKKGHQGESHPMFGKKHTAEAKLASGEKKKGKRAWSKDGVCVMSKDCPGEGWFLGNVNRTNGPWNKNLTLENDPRVKNYIEKMKRTRYSS